MLNISDWESMEPTLYHRHFAFLDFSKIGVPKPLYYNIIRKPLEKFVSYYYFIRCENDYKPYLIRKTHGNTMTFDKCVSKNHPDCNPNNMLLQIPFFFVDTQCIVGNLATSGL